MVFPFLINWLKYLTASKLFKPVRSMWTQKFHLERQMQAWMVIMHDSFTYTYQGIVHQPLTTTSSQPTARAERIPSQYLWSSSIACILCLFRLSQWCISRKYKPYLSRIPIKSKFREMINYKLHNVVKNPSRSPY